MRLFQIGQQIVSELHSNHHKVSNFKDKVLLLVANRRIKLKLSKRIYLQTNQQVINKNHLFSNIP